MRPPPEKPINVNAITQKIAVDNRIPIRNYYRIADNLLKQASIYREEKNIIDLYIILLRYVSLVTETIPLHRDYQMVFTKDRAFNKKKAFAVMDEAESLKPKFQRVVNELNKAHDRDGQYRVGAPSKSYPSEASNSGQSSHLNKQSGQIISSLHMQTPCQTQVVQPSALDIQFQKLSINMPLPKQETLSRHSFLGPNGFRSQWLAPRPEIKVQYPSYSDFTSSDNLGLIHPAEHEIAAAKDNISKLDLSPMESVLSLDDGEWNKPSSVNIEANNDHLPLGIIRQPSPPPVLAQIQPEYHPISPSRVADPRPGPVKSFQDGTASSNSYQNLHIPVKLMDDFLRLARQNTEKNLETCGVLAGSLKNRVFHITTLIIPKQESTSDSCETLNEEDIYDVQDKLSLFPLGWIHTHPTQTCFMSSVDLHTHYSYQIMLPEAIAIVMAPTDTSSPHGIFHLSDPGGVSTIRNCQQRGFHPHEEPDDGSPIYEHCSHVFINENMRFDIIDLRKD